MSEGYSNTAKLYPYCLRLYSVRIRRGDVVRIFSNVFQTPRTSNMQRNERGFQINCGANILINQILCSENKYRHGEIVE